MRGFEQELFKLLFEFRGFGKFTSPSVLSKVMASFDALLGIRI